MSEPRPGLNHGAVLDGHYLRLRERNHEGIGEAEGLYTKGHALWRDLQRAEVFARVCNAKVQSYLEQLAVEMARVEELEKWRDAVLGLVDGLDDPHIGLSWFENTREVCAAELEHLRSVLVPLVRGDEGRRG